MVTSDVATVKDGDRDAPQRKDKSAIARFLRGRTTSAGRTITYTTAANLAGGLLAIAQAFVIALIVNDVVFAGARLEAQWPWLGLLFFVICARASMHWLGEGLAALAATRVHTALVRDLVAHVRAIGPVGLSDRPTGETVSALTESLNAIEPYYARYLPASSMSVLLPVAIALAVLPFDWMTVVVFIVTAPLIVLFMILIGAGAERLNQRQWRKLARLAGQLLDAIQGLVTLKMFGASRREARNVAKMAEDYRRETMTILRLAFLSSLVLEFFATVSIAIVAVLIGFRLLWGEMTFVNGFFILLLAPEFYAPLRTLGSAYHARMEAIGAAERVVDFYALPEMAQRGDGTRAVTGALRDIRFEDVGLTYRDGRTGLSGFSLSIRAGETLALVGPSGGGKSTVLNVLLGFVGPTSGTVAVNGEALGTLDLAAWRNRIAYLPQRPHMFNASISANIAMALAGEAIDFDRVRDAVRRASFDQVVAGLPEGYDTLVGERGFGLSGGEVQRLALARAFYRDAEIVLVDEATAHLDSESERLVQSALETLIAERTCVMIAHRLHTVAMADRVAQVEGGRVVRTEAARTFLGAKAE